MSWFMDSRKHPAYKYVSGSHTPTPISVVACSGTKNGRYNTNLSVERNTGLSPELVRVFDLVFVIHDTEAVRDRTVGAARTRLDVGTAAKYMSLARTVRPSVSADASTILGQRYVEAHKTYDMVPRVTPRHAASTVRLAVARAKIELRETVTWDDARYAADMVYGALADAVPKGVVDAPHAY